MRTAALFSLIMAMAGSASRAEPVCNAGRLPRPTERSFTAENRKALEEAAAHHGVGVVWDGAHATVVQDCVLDGSYLDIPARSGPGHLRPATRVLFRVDEIRGACQRATHVVSIYATQGVQLRAVLVPLPCPSIHDQNRSAGCIAKGTTGAERVARAQALEGNEVAAQLELFALEPDGALGLQTVARVSELTLASQGGWLLQEYELERSDDGLRQIAKPSRRWGQPPVALAWNARQKSFRVPPPFIDCFQDFIDADFQYEVDP